MFNNQYFYNKTTRKVVAVFGTLFNNINVGRIDGNGKLTNIKAVPIAYGPRQKYLARIAERPDLTSEKVAILLPRMSFEASAPIYDIERQVSKLSKHLIKSTVNNQSVATKVWSPVPYRIPFELNIMTRNQDEALQILEQIIPYFKPSLGVRIMPVEGRTDITDEIKIIIQSISKSDTYDNGFNTLRNIIYTITFDVLVNYYSYIDNNIKVIKTSIVSFKDSNTNNDIETITAAVNPQSADKNGVYTIDISTQTFGF